MQICKQYQNILRADQHQRHMAGISRGDNGEHNVQTMVAARLLLVPVHAHLLVIVHRRDAENAKRMNIFLSAEGAERKKLSF